jgi:hypothetical protein
MMIPLSGLRVRLFRQTQFMVYKGVQDKTFAVIRQIKENDACRQHGCQKQPQVFFALSCRLGAACARGMRSPAEKKSLQTAPGSFIFPVHGEMSERLKEHDWKSCVR